MIYTRANWSMNRIDSKYGRLEDCNVQDGDVFERCNLSQIEPTNMFDLVENLEFRQCNLVNCILPLSSSVENCNTAQISRCSNLHQEWSFKNPCPENCDHVVDIDEIIIDGVTIDTIYHYKDTRL